MDSIQPIWNLFLLFSLFALPQLIGVLAYFRIRRLHHLLAHLAGFLIPPALFFYFSRMVFTHPAHEGQAEGGCGMAAVAAGFIILGGTAMQMFFSLVSQLLLRVGRKAGVGAE